MHNMIHPLIKCTFKETYKKAKSVKYSKKHKIKNVFFLHQVDEIKMAMEHSWRNADQNSDVFGLVQGFFG